jgi:hypothetical protein
MVFALLFFKWVPRGPFYSLKRAHSHFPFPCKKDLNFLMSAVYIILRSSRPLKPSTAWYTGQGTRDLSHDSPEANNLPKATTRMRPTTRSRPRLTRDHTRAGDAVPICPRATSDGRHSHDSPEHNYDSPEANPRRETHFRLA